MKGVSDFFWSPRDTLRDPLHRGEMLLDQAMRGNPWHIRRRSTLLVAGEHHEYIYRLIAGTLARVLLLQDGRRQIVRFFAPGDLIGLPAMLFQHAADTVEALSQVSLLKLRSSAALDLAARNPDVALRLMWQLAQDERRLRNQNIALAKGTALERVAAMLAEIGGWGSFTGIAREKRIIDVRQRDIADYVGLTVVHVNRTLRRLRDHGTIAVVAGAISVRDWPAILSIAAPMLDGSDRSTETTGSSINSVRQKPRKAAEDTVVSAELADVNPA